MWYHTALTIIPLSSTLSSSFFRPIPHPTSSDPISHNVSRETILLYLCTFFSVPLSFTFYRLRYLSLNHLACTFIFQFLFHSLLSPFPTFPHLAINPIPYHISHHIFHYPILSYHIPILSHIVTITTYIVFNTTCNPICITYHVLQYYLISLLIYYVNSQVRLC